MSNPAPGYPPYRAKNGPIDDLSELLMVRGIGENPAVYWGSQGEGRIQLPASQLRARRSALETPIYEIGLVDLFTPMSSRLLNVNTASVKALQIIPEIDENVAHAIITARAGPDGADGTEDDTPFRSVAEMARVPGMHPNAVAQLGRFYTVRSQTFEVKVTARIGSTAREFTAVLGRTSRDIQVLNMYWK
jgi:DNA uptake protein ComE-like DNA-binding protein